MPELIKLVVDDLSEIHIITDNDLVLAVHSADGKTSILAGGWTSAGNLANVLEHQFPRQSVYVCRDPYRERIELPMEKFASFLRMYPDLRLCSAIEVAREFLDGAATQYDWTILQFEPCNAGSRLLSAKSDVIALASSSPVTSDAATVRRLWLLG